MIYNTDISIALKDNSGKYSSKQFSVFDIEKLVLGFPSLEVIAQKKRELAFRVKCPICGEYHYYNYRISEFIKREMVIGGCEITGVPIFFIGKGAKVSERINKYNKISNKIYAMI